jgi:hypothetical protein
MPLIKGADTSGLLRLDPGSLLDMANRATGAFCVPIFRCPRFFPVMGYTGATDSTFGVSPALP